MDGARTLDPMSLSPEERMTWRLHSEVVLLAGWGRAILMQLAHPLVAAGVDQHSAFLRARWGRLRRLRHTIRSMLALTFGTPEEAERVASAIRRIHDRVHGVAEAGGGARAGEPARYSAHDPALLTWVHATLLDSFLLTYERFVAPLTEMDRDRYCAESTAIEPMLGLPAGRVPRSAGELRTYLSAVLASGDIAVTDAARRLSKEIIDPPSLLIGRPLVVLARLATIGLLPPDIRVAYGFSWDARRERRLDTIAAFSRRLLPLLPSPLRHWPEARAARRRRHHEPQ